MAAKRAVPQPGSKTLRLLFLALQSAVLVAAWTFLNRPGPGLFRLALVYVLAMWTVAGVIKLWISLAFSIAPFLDLLVACLQGSATSMWLVPGALLLASRSQLAVVVGLAAVVNSTRLLTSNRVPKEQTIRSRRRAHRKLELLFFDNLPKQRVYWSWEMGLTTLGALALQTGLYALAGDYPLLAVVSFAAATAIWTALSIARGATEATTGGRAPYLGPGILLTLLLTVTLTAALLDAEIAQQSPGEGAGAAQTAGGTSITRRVLSRLAHVPPMPAPLSSVGVGTPKRVVSRVVDAGPAIGEKGQNGVSGVVLRPRLRRSQRVTLIAPGPRPRFSLTESLVIPFTGEYHLYRTSSESLPTGAIVEAGTPLESLYGTTDGSPMETVAVQMFELPIDLSHGGKVWVAVESAESTPLLASMQLVAKGSVADCGVDLIGIKSGREQLLEFEVPVTARPLLVRAIRISFQHPGPDCNKSVRIAVERITLAPRLDAELRERFQD